VNVRVLLSPPPYYRRRHHRLRWVRRALLTIAICSLGYTGYVYLDSEYYQARDEQAFDRESSEHRAAAEQPPPPGSSAAPGVLPGESGAPNEQPPAIPDGLIGRIAIPRLHVRAIGKEGVDSKTLRRAGGHVPGTALPGEDGNVGLAGHRDTFFRGLREVHKNDRITLETVDREYEYVVESMKVVGPKDVQVLSPTRNPVLTLVTCYPFHYIGNAPRRFIVRARQVATSPRESQGS
jgi:sortase A